NERAVYLHIMEDVLGWVAVLAMSIVMLFTNLPILDPIMSIAISIWVLINVYGTLKSTFKIFLQAIPDELNIDQLKSSIEEIKEIENIHDLHVWTLDGTSHVMTLHVTTSASDKSDLKEQIYAIGHNYHIEHITIEFESGSDKCEYNSCKL
ncbi:MAG: cation diffusion facilitator family transporter, partial [Rikenellaceae bacterium]